MSVAELFWRIIYNVHVIFIMLNVQTYCLGCSGCWCSKRTWNSGDVSGRYLWLYNDIIILSVDSNP